MIFLGKLKKPEEFEKVGSFIRSVSLIVKKGSQFCNETLIRVINILWTVGSRCVYPD